MNIQRSTWRNLKVTLTGREIRRWKSRKHVAVNCGFRKKNIFIKLYDVTDEYMSLLACAVFDSIYGRKIKFLTKSLRQRKQLRQGMQSGYSSPNPSPNSNVLVSRITTKI